MKAYFDQVIPKNYEEPKYDLDLKCEYRWVDTIVDRKWKTVYKSFILKKCADGTWEDFHHPFRDHGVNI